MRVAFRETSPHNGRQPVTAQPWPPIRFYGRLCPLDESLADDEIIPGLAIFTTRAQPLATWMTGLEVAYFKVGRINMGVPHRPVTLVSFSESRPLTLS